MERSEPIPRIEGEGKVVIKISEGKVEVEVVFSEPQRHFERILRGIDVESGADIVSRICGLCGTSHMYAYVKSFERDVEIPSVVEEYRRALLSVERIKSHLIHTCFLYLPDILNVRSMNEMYDKFRELASACLELYSAVYKLAGLLEYRLHNVVNIRVGGVYSFPSRDRVARALDSAREFREGMEKILSALSARLDLFEERHSFEVLTALSSSYPASSSEVVYGDRVIASSSYEENLVEVSSEGSTGKKYCFIDGEVFVTGPLARCRKYGHMLRGVVDEYLSIYGISVNAENVYASIVARIAEMLHSLDEIENFAQSYRDSPTKRVDVRPSSDDYSVFVEAPRGVLYHRHSVANGRIVDSRIVTPTQLNAFAMERLPLQIIKNYSEEAIDRVRMIVRSLDPCLSCAVHVVKLE